MFSWLRTILWSHSLASWAAFTVVWVVTLRSAVVPPLDGRFWLIFGVTEGLAPIWLPVSMVIYQPVLDATVAMIAGAYVPVFLMSAIWHRRRENRQLATVRRSAGQCASCGYDLRATRGRCPECGVEIPDSATASASPVR